MIGTFPTIPGGFRRGHELFGLVADVIAPPVRMSISEAAAKHRRFRTLDGSTKRWDPNLFPPMEEVMSWMESRDVGEVYVMGPSQFGKTELMLNVSIHALLYDPADIIILQPSEKSAGDFVGDKVDPALQASVDMDGETSLKARLSRGRRGDTATTKVFKNGMTIEVIWPTTDNLSSRTRKIAMVDELDRMTMDVGGTAKRAGDGDPVKLIHNRIKSAGKDGKLLVACSPSRTDGTGIAALVKGATMHLMAVPCDHCAEWFTPGYTPDRKPTLAHLHIADWTDPNRSREEAELICSHCGGRHAPSERKRLISVARLVPRGCEILPDGTMVGPAPEGRARSVAFHGLLSPFDTWGDLAAALVEAHIQFVTTGNERPMQTVMNTRFGVSYVPEAEGSGSLDTDELRSRRVAGLRVGEVPAGVRYLTASVDIQKTKFAVAIFGHDEFGSVWIIDRFDILTLTDGVTPVRPPSHADHWDVLFPRVMEVRYPLADRPGLSLGIASVAVDTGGYPGTAEAAKAWWWRARGRGWPEEYLTMIKGSSNTAAPVIAPPSYELDPKGRPLKAGYRWFMLGVHSLKDTIKNRFQRDEPGPGSIYLPSDLADEWLDELTAEVREPRGWRKIRRANETLDCLAYAIAASLRVRPARFNWRVPKGLPSWAVPMTEAQQHAEWNRLGIRRTNNPAVPGGAVLQPAPVGPNVRTVAAPAGAGISAQPPAPAPAGPRVRTIQAPAPAGAARVARPVRPPASYVMGWKK